MIKLNKKGFTLIEVLIVVAILSIMAMIIVPGIMKYIQTGKDNYDKSLKNELLVTGKDYFAANKNLLPKKNYLQKQQVVSNYVTLPEMQSKNYISKDFIDSEGRKCTQSFVLVRQERGTVDNEWHPCLICEGVNHSSDDKYCDISNFNDSDNPTCSSNITGGTNYGNYVFNPEAVKITDIVNNDDDSKIAYIRVVNHTIDEPLWIEVNGRDDAMGINIIDKMKRFFNDNGKIKDGLYSIDIMNASGKFSTDNCGKQIVIDNTKPNCELIYNPISSSDKNFKFNVSDNSVTNGWANKESIKGVIDQIDNNKDIDYSKVSIERPLTDGMYYGHVKDFAGNENICSNDVKVKMFDDEPPYCSFASSYSNWLGIGKSAQLNLYCYVADAKSATIDNNKISSLIEAGTVTANNDTSQNDNPDLVKFIVNYSTITGKYGDDKAVVNPGFISNSNGLENEEATSGILKVDGVKPKITYTPLTSKHADGWYYATFKVSIGCSDNYSGVAGFTVNGVAHTNPYTATRSSAAKPVSYTSACTDKAGNKSDDSKNYYVREYSEDKDCGIASYKTCRTSGCGCETRNRCSACGCASYSYSYDWGSTGSNSGSSNPGSGISTCKKANVGKYKRWKITCVSCVRGGHAYAPGCNIPRNNRCNKYTWKYKICKSSKKCSTYNRCSSCSCATYNSCANSACGVKSYKTCWHY